MHPVQQQNSSTKEGCQRLGSAVTGFWRRVVLPNAPLPVLGGSLRRPTQRSSEHSTSSAEGGILYAVAGSYVSTQFRDTGSRCGRGVLGLASDAVLTSSPTYVGVIA